MNFLDILIKMDFSIKKELKIQENLSKIQSLKQGNLYCLQQIARKPAKWEVKEYKGVIKDNLHKIHELAEHNKRLGGFK